MCNKNMCDNKALLYYCIQAKMYYVYLKRSDS